MIERLNRNLGTEDDLREGEYVSIPHEHTTGTMITVVVACPLCGEKKRLDASYVVNRVNGDVTPAFKCSGCVFFDWIRLDGWAEVPK